jgi:adenylyl cyclase-associated protein
VKKEKKPSKSKDMRGNWVFENYKNEQLVIPKDDCSFRTAVNIFDCVDCTFTFEGKIKGLMMEKCKKSTLIVEEVVAPVEVINCDTVKVNGIKQLNHVSVENSVEVRVILTNATRACCVQTTCARNVLIRFPKEGKDDQSQENEDWATMIIPEAFETKVLGDSIKT